MRLEAAQRLMPLSVACRSISASSSALKSSRSSAATFASSCATLLAPISVDVTRGSRSAHASASCASDWPRRCAISFSARIFARASSVSRSGESDLSLRRPRALGDAVQVAVGEHPLRERREDDAADADLPERVEQVRLDPAVQHRVRRLVDQERRAQRRAGSPPPRASSPPSRTRCRRTAPCPAARPCRARPSSPRAASPGRTGASRRCRRSRGPCAARLWSRLASRYFRDPHSPYGPGHMS